MLGFLFGLAAVVVFAFMAEKINSWQEKSLREEGYEPCPCGQGWVKK